MVAIEKGRAAKSAIPERDCGNAEQSLFRRIAPYDRTKKSQICIVFVWLLL